MSSRYLSAGLAAAILIGWTAEAAAQAGGRSRQRVRSPDATATDSPAAGNDGTAAAQAGTPSGSSEGQGTKDAFDDAAAKVKGGDAKAGVSPGDAKTKLEKATFGAGCFWHVEAEFEWLPGVKSAVSGYAGGHVANPTYEMVHEGDTGHAEVVQVTYDPSVISYEQLLKVFWHGHDPTQWNRQGPDIGPQYRSVIFYHNEEQRKAALKSYRELTAARVYRAPIVTQLFPMTTFYRAEEYHQNYYGGKPDAPVARSLRSRRTGKAVARKGTGAAARATAARKGANVAKPADGAKDPSSAPAPSAARDPQPEP
jgi:peptide-methionine (S)-S-oxide reductase